MNETETSTERKSLFNDDPTDQLALLDKYVKINVIRNNSFEGFIHSIDPLTRSIILFVPQSDLHQIILIPGQAIIDVFEISPPSHITPSIRKLDEIEFEEHTTDRKEKIIDWLKKNLIPVTEIGDKVVIGNAFILPPYSLFDICTDNPIVALQIKKIIGSMPDHYEPNK